MENSGRARPVRIALIGTVGVPARYGGFETLADNLAAHREEHDLPCELDIYCSGKAYAVRPAAYRGARLHYVPLDANGISSIAYDAVSILRAIWRGADVLLVLGVSGTLLLPLVRLLSAARIVVNVDGVEWKRAKWNRAAAAFLRWSERAAVRFADVVIADNQGIVEHIGHRYGREAVMIAYGGDHALAGRLEPPRQPLPPLPERYALMLCRIEPENHVQLILESFAGSSAMPLIAVGNWDASDYGRRLRKRFADTEGLNLLDPVYDPGALFRVRDGASLYVHGHSAGGTNPALVEMMALGRPVAAFDCDYNRHTTLGRALYFRGSEDLVALTRSRDEVLAANAAAMASIALEHYTWAAIGRSYFRQLIPDDPA